MIVRLYLKDPDCLFENVKDALAKTPQPVGVTDEEWETILENRQSEVEDAITKRWLEYGEYLTVDIDLDADTATVIPIR